MAQRVLVTMVDDLDGGEATETVTFALDGITYEIDLSEKNAAKLRKSLEPFAEKGRRIGKQGGKRKSGGSSGKAAQVRAWAAEQGIAVPAKGRVPADVAAQYDAAQVPA